MNKKVSVAEIKTHFSEYISKVAYLKKSIIITKRDKPIAALIDLNSFQRIENSDEINGLISVIGKWKRFEEIESSIEQCYKSRGKDELRKVSL